MRNIFKTVLTILAVVVMFHVLKWLLCLLFIGSLVLIF